MGRGLRRAAGLWAMMVVWLGASAGAWALDAIGSGDAEPGPDTGAPSAASEIPCGHVEFQGCCENGTVFWCDPLGFLRTMSCRENQRYTACGLEGPFANCMEPAAAEAPRCSSRPTPAGGGPLPDAGALAGSCPRLPASLSLAAGPAAPARCPEARTKVAVHQVGCAFTADALSGEEAGPAFGQIDGRVVQLSYKTGRTTVTCLGAIADDDGSIAVSCDGPWGFDATACGWTYEGAIDWAPSGGEGDGPDGGTSGADTGGGEQRPTGDAGDSGGGGGGGCASGAPSGSAPPRPFAVLFLGAGLAVLLLRRRAA